MEVKHRDEIVDRATVEVSVKPRSGLPSTFEKTVESQIRGTFESAILATLHPRTLMSIVVQVLSHLGTNIPVLISFFVVIVL